MSAGRTKHIWTPREIAEMLHKMQLNKYDGIVCVDGLRGTGKSTLAWKICKFFQDFHPRKDIIFSRSDLHNGLMFNKYKVLMADEVINQFYRRDFWNAEQKDLIKLLNMVRSNYNILVMCLPNFYSLDKDIRELVKIRLTVIRRGYAVVQFPTKKLYSSDRWDIKINQKLEEEWMKSKKPRYHKFTTYQGILRFKDMTPRNRKIYEQIKEQRREEVMGFKGEIENPESKTLTDKIIAMAKEKRLVKKDLEQFCEVLGRDPDSIINSCNRKMKVAGELVSFRQLLKANTEQKQEYERQKFEKATGSITVVKKYNSFGFRI